MWFFVFVGEFTTWLYRSGGFLVLAVVVAVLIAMATHPASPLGGWLGTQPWRYIGQRSYGLYLWHWPIFMVTRPQLDVPLDGIPLLALRLALTFGIAELSFRFVEMPIRHGAIDRWVKAWRASTGAERTRRTRRGAAVLASAMAGDPARGHRPRLGPRAVGGGGPRARRRQRPRHRRRRSDRGEPRRRGPEPPAASPSARRPAAATRETPAAKNPNGNLSALGDSVMLGARTVLKEAIPGTKVDAAVSRFPGAFIGRLKKYVARDKLADVVVLHPGTNGVLPEDMMRDMLDVLKDTPTVVVVNNNMPRSWRTPNNKVIDKVVPDYANAVLVDWYAASKDHPEYFVSDGIHLTPKGARAYAKLIKSALPGL